MKKLILLLALLPTALFAQDFRHRYFHYNQIYTNGTSFSISDSDGNNTITLPKQADADDVDLILGDVTTTAPVFTIRGQTADTDDDSILQLTPGGSSTMSGTRGAYIKLEGADIGGVNYGGDISIIAGVGASNTTGQFPTVTIGNDGVDASDWGRTSILGGGGAYVIDGSRGSQITLSGNENGLFGNVDLRGGDTGNGGGIRMYTGNNNLMWTVPRIGGSATISDFVAGASGVGSQVATLRFAYADAADTGTLQLTGGGSATLSGTRGAYISMQGNDVGGVDMGGDITISGGLGKANTAGNYPITTIQNDTADAGDWGEADLLSAGARGVTRGADVTVYGNEHVNLGSVYISTGLSGQVIFYTGDASSIRKQRWTMPALADNDDADLYYSQAAATAPIATIRSQRADGSDDATLHLLAGGADGTTRGAGITLLGNDVGGAGAGAGITAETGTGTTNSFVINQIGLNKLALAATADLDDVTLVLGANSTTAPVFKIRGQTTDGDDDGVLKISPGGDAGDFNRGAYLILSGNEIDNGKVYLHSGYKDAGHMYFGTAGIVRWTISGESTNLPSELAFGPVGVGGVTGTIRSVRTDGADDATLVLTAGGASTVDTARGAGITLLGDDVGGAGAGAGMTLEAGTGTAGTIKFNTAGANKWTINADGTLDAAVTDIGWRIAAQADTACTTTCGASKGCVFGQNTAALTYIIVACSDATADVCVCTTT